MRVVPISILILFLFMRSAAQTVELRGTVADDRGSPIPFTSVWITEIHQGGLTNEQGYYRFILKPGIYTLGFRLQGYKPLFQTIHVEDKQVNYDLHLSRIIESAMVPNAADSIVSKVIARQNTYQPQSTAYSGNLYTKELQRLDRVPKNLLKHAMAYQLRMNPDSKGIINLSESLAEFQINPNNYITKQVTAAIMIKNSKDLFNFNSVPGLHIDFYQNTLLLNGFIDHAFISPLSDHALDHYRYQLIGQFIDQEKVIDEIRVIPIRRDEHLFSGTIYIVDKEWLLFSIDLRLSRDAHLDFIDSVRITQQFVPVDSSTWLPQTMQFSFWGKFWGYGYSGRFLQVYQDIHASALSRDPRHKAFYSTVADYRKNEKFWEQNRPVLLTTEEDHFYQLTKQTENDKRLKAISDSLQNKSNRFHLLPYILLGYTLHNYSNNSSLAIQSPYNVGFYNTVEGWGLDLKVKYNRAYDREHSLTLIPEIRYGSSNHVLNGNLFAQLIFNPFRHASVYGRMGTDFLDLNNTGTVSTFLNSLSTLYLGNNYIKLYQAKFIMAGASGEIANGILLNGQLEYADRNSLFNTSLHSFNSDSLLTSNNPLNPNSNSPLFPHYRAFTLRGSATFTFNQDYMITPAGKFILPNPYPRVRVNFRMGIPALGSNVNYEFLSVDLFQDKLNTGVYGYTGYSFTAGTFLNTKSLYYPDYNHFHGGESFFFDATLGGFHFLNYYTYSTYKTYFEAHAEHNFTGILLNRVPLINRLGLQEIIGGSYLAQGTLPAYKEVYIGLKRTVIRLDYGLAFGRFSRVMQGLRFSYNLPGL